LGGAQLRMRVEIGGGDGGLEIQDAHDGPLFAKMS
jgi:hypothetical protein